MAELVYVGLGLQNSFLCISIDNFQVHVFICYSLKTLLQSYIPLPGDIGSPKKTHSSLCNWKIISGFNQHSQPPGIHSLHDTGSNDVTDRVFISGKALDLTFSS